MYVNILTYFLRFVKGLEVICTVLMQKKTNHTKFSLDCDWSFLFLPLEGAAQIIVTV
jgi:hypothetical protein